jgi:hypothetical protein
MSDYQSYYVDVDGRTYRVVLAGTDSMRPLAIFRRHINHDVGPALAIEGRIGKQAVAKAQQQRREALA